MLNGRFGTVLHAGDIKMEKVRNEDMYLGDGDLIGINVVTEGIYQSRLGKLYSEREN